MSAALRVAMSVPTSRAPDALERTLSKAIGITSNADASSALASPAVSEKCKTCPTFLAGNCSSPKLVGRSGPGESESAFEVPADLCW